MHLAPFKNTTRELIMTSEDAIRFFLDSQRIALVETSPNSMDFSRYVFKALRNRGLDVIPVHPWAQEIAGQKAYKSVRDIPRGIDAALLMIPPEKSEQMTRDCIDAGAHVVWFHRGLGRGAATDESVRLCEEAGVLVVPGECPLMYLERPGFMHSLSAFARSTSNVFETVRAR